MLSGDVPGAAVFVERQQALIGANKKIGQFNPPSF
jgi:hypothetical protein